MSTKFEIRLKDEDFADLQGMAIIKREDGKVYVAKPLEWEELQPGSFINSTLEVRREHGDIFMDLKANLKRLGYINNVNDATLAATKEHLGDMRKIAFQAMQPPIKIEE